MESKILSPDERIDVLSDVYKLLATYFQEKNITKNDAFAAMANLIMSLCLDSKVPYESYCDFMNDCRDQAKPFFDGVFNE